MKKQFPYPVLDACCGGRQFWFDKKNPRAIFIDYRSLQKHKLVNRQSFEVKPDIIMDFRDLRFDANTFSLVVFDPPHTIRSGKSSWLVKKYGKLDNATWRNDLRRGFAECFRVLKQNGVLIFKWSEYEIPLSEVLALTPVKPLFGHASGKQSKTHWVAFMK